jgi:hypothetical protein
MAYSLYDAKEYELNTGDLLYFPSEFYQEVFNLTEECISITGSIFNCFYLTDPNILSYEPDIINFYSTKIQNEDLLSEIESLSNTIPGVSRQVFKINMILKIQEFFDFIFNDEKLLNFETNNRLREIIKKVQKNF